MAEALGPQSSPSPIGRTKISSSRSIKNKLFQVLCAGSAVLGVLFLCIVLFGAIRSGFSSLSLDFITGGSTSNFRTAGIEPALIGTLWIVILTLLISVPIGIAAAIYIEEIARKTKFNQFIQVNIANLAGVPSVIYGLLGLGIFVTLFGMGRSILAAALTMSLLVLPTVILTTQEALRTVPKAYRDGSLAMGASPWQTLLRMTLPCALPPIFTGMILAASRAIGETAPLLVIGALVFTRSTPDDVNDRFTVLPIQIFNWSSRPQEEWHHLASAAIIVLLAILLTLNFTAIILRNKTKRI